MLWRVCLWCALPSRTLPRPWAGRARRQSRCSGSTFRCWPGTSGSDTKLKQSILVKLAAYRQSLAGQNPILFTTDAADAAGPW